MTLIRNPHDIDMKTRAPKCFGNYSDDAQVCTHHCSKALNCSNETDDEVKRRDSRDLRGPDGRKVCFGKLYSEFSEECQNHCLQSYDCGDVVLNDELSIYQPEWEPRRASMPSTTSTGIRSPSLSVLQNKPPLPPMPMYQTQPNYVSPFSSQYSSGSQYQNLFANQNVDDRTQAYLKAKYGIGLKPDPTVPGQFEGEEWYVRFFKEILKYAGYYAFQLLSQILITNRWAPNISKDMK